MEYTVNTTRMLERFLSYVKISSETSQELPMCQRMKEELTQLGLIVEECPVPDWVGSDGYNIVATLEGDPSLEPIFFSAHLDTVTNGANITPVVCEDGYVRSDGTTILGGDDKGGVAAIMETIEAAKALAIRPTLQVIFTVREEVGLLGAKAMDFSKIVAKKGVVLDSAGSASWITTSSPGQNRIHITIHGKASHAGIAPSSGISAIAVGAEAVSAMTLFQVDEETTSNIGTFHGESPTNILCDKVTMILEARSRNHSKLEKQTSHITQTVEEICEKYGATCEIRVDTAYVGFHLQDNHPIVEEVIEACRAVGLQPETIGSGGGSDANVFNEKGIPTVNLAMGMDKVHSTQERLSLEDMYLASEVCYQMIAKYNQ